MGKKKFLRKQTKPNKLNYNSKGLKKTTYLRDICTANLRSTKSNSQHIPKKKNTERINRD